MKTIFTAAALIFALATAGNAEAASPYVTVVNDSSQGIFSIEMIDIDHHDDGDWGADLLGANTLPVGYELPGMAPSGIERDYCRYDLRVTFNDGGMLVINDFNACRTRTVTVHDRSFDLEEIDGDIINRRGISGTL